MADLKTQRNVAIGAAAVAVAFAAGYLISSGRPAAPSSPGETTALATEAAAAAAAAYEEPATAPSRTAAEAPAQRAATPVAGERRRSSAPAAAATAPEPEAMASAPAASDPPAAYEPPVRRLEPVVVPQSTQIELTLVEGISSQTAQVGDAVVAELAAPIRVDGRVVVPAGTRVTGRVTEAQALKKVGGKSILGLAFDRLESGDGGAEIAAAFRREGKSETGKDAATIAAGAAVGTILGNQAKKNDRGKLIGAVVGAAAGTAVAAKTEGETIELPAGSRLELTLREDVEVLIDG